jgi:PmbA protein
VRSLEALKEAAQTAFDVARRAPGVSEVEVFVGANATLLTRLNYTSHIPCNGVEEPKSVESYGVGLQVVFDGPDGPQLGFGSEPSDLSAAGAARALDKARAAAVVDPDFVSLPRPSATARTLTDYHDPVLMALPDARLVDAGWTVVNGALRTFLASSRLAELASDDETLRQLGLIVGGDVTILAERIAVVSTALPRVQTDESTMISAFVTAMVESRGAKGSGWSTGTRLDHLTDEAGSEAAQAAIASVGGARVDSGRYRVVFGRQPVTDLLDNIVVPACRATAFYASASPFLGRLGAPVASAQLSIYDDGAMPGRMASKGITCEGLPSGRTDLIRHGVLTGCLASWYESRRLLRDPRRAEKLGGVDDAARAAALVPRNGFRFGSGGGRQYDQRPGAASTNVVVEGAEGVSRDELLRRVGNGLYIGRIWYTYPINGLRAGDFTCTVVADSYIIRDGRIAEPIKPNTIRINDNIATFLNNVVGVTKDAKGTVVWGTDQATYAPEIAVYDVRVDHIAGFMEDLDG